jgi:hypothetical protein
MTRSSMNSSRTFVCGPRCTLRRPTSGQCAYLDGFNTARSGGPLLGFQQWLVVRANDGNNLHWSALARRLLPDDPAGAESSDEERAVRALGRLLGEFLEYRRANGITKVFHEYTRWLLRRSWYTGPLRQGSGRSAGIIPS